MNEAVTSGMKNPSTAYVRTRQPRVTTAFADWLPNQTTSQCHLASGSTRLLVSDGRSDAPLTACPTFHPADSFP